MPDIEKTVLSLYYHEELTLREISKIVNLHESRISQLKTQAILRLRSYMEKRWPSHAGSLNQVDPARTSILKWLFGELASRTQSAFEGMTGERPGSGDAGGRGSSRGCGADVASGIYRSPGRDLDGGVGSGFERGRRHGAGRGGIDRDGSGQAESRVPGDPESDALGRGTGDVRPAGTRGSTRQMAPK